MEKLFLQIINMSMSASYVILFVILIRFLLKKLPKIYSYSLWLIVLFRLLVPFSVSSAFSMIPVSSKAVPSDIMYSPKPQIHSGITTIDKLVNNSLPAPAPQLGASINPIQIWISLGQLIWLVGIFILLVYSVLTTLKLIRKLKLSKHLKGNIYEVGHIDTPFVFGLLRPKIYLPFGLSEMEQSYMIKHEETHIKRFDHIIKFIFFIARSIHWFNPLVWLAFFLMSKDMELSCDEKVIAKMGSGIKKDYSHSLLSLSNSKKVIGSSPLAFGGENTKGRIKNILNYKKPKFWATLVGIIAIVIAVVGLLSNPKAPGTLAVKEETLINEELWKARTKYLGDNSSVGKIVNQLQFPNDVTYDYFELDTKERPYGIKINFKTDTETQNFYSETNNQGLFQTNALMVFSLIENAEYITFNLDDGTNNSYYIRYTNDIVKGILGENYFKESETLEGFHILLEKIGGYGGSKKNDNALAAGQEIELSNFKYDGQDAIEKLVYDTEIERDLASNNRGGFIIVAPKIFASYEEEDMLRVFVTTYSARYKLFGNTLSEESGGIIPAAITYRKDSNGEYTLKKYEQAKDGSEFFPSIRRYCTMPISEKEIEGLADKILNHYGNYEDIRILHFDNLYEHLKKNNIKDATLTYSQGEVRFSMSDPKHSQ